MAFTELNFVPGEIVTAAKMNLLAANDVWLRENGGGMKFLNRVNGSKSKLYGNTSNLQDVVSIPILESARGKNLFIIACFNFIEECIGIGSANISLYSGGTPIGHAPVRIRSDHSDDFSDKMTNQLAFLHTVLDSSNDSVSEIKAKIMILDCYSAAPEFSLKYDIVVFEI